MIIKVITFKLYSACFDNNTLIFYTFTFLEYTGTSNLLFQTVGLKSFNLETNNIQKMSPLKVQIDLHV